MKTTMWGGSFIEGILIRVNSELGLMRACVSRTQEQKEGYKKNIEEFLKFASKAFAGLEICARMQAGNPPEMSVNQATPLQSAWIIWRTIFSDETDDESKKSLGDLRDFFNLLFWDVQPDEQTLEKNIRFVADVISRVQKIVRNW